MFRTDGSPARACVCACVSVACVEKRSGNLSGSSSYFPIDFHDLVQWPPGISRETRFNLKYLIKNKKNSNSTYVKRTRYW